MFRYNKQTKPDRLYLYFHATLFLVQQLVQHIVSELFKVLKILTFTFFYVEFTLFCIHPILQEFNWFLDI